MEFSIRYLSCIVCLSVFICLKIFFSKGQLYLKYLFRIYHLGQGQMAYLRQKDNVVDFFIAFLNFLYDQKTEPLKSTFHILDGF